MSETISLEAVLKLVDQGYKSGMEAAKEAQEELAQETDKASESITKQMTIANLASKAISMAFGAIMNSVGDAVKRIDTLNNYPKVMESLGYSSAEAEKSVNDLSEGIDGLPTTLDSIVSSSQRLTASLGDLGEGTKTAVALNDLFLAGGGGAEAAARGMEQYNQMLAAGKVDMQSWKTLLEVAPGQMNQLAQSMLGASADQKTLYDALQNGTVTIQQLNDAVIQLDQQGGEGFASFAEQARAATGGIGTAWANIKTAVTKGVAQVIQEFDKGMKAASGAGVADNFNKIKKVISDVFNVVAKVAGFIGKHFEAIIKVVGLAVGAFAAFSIVTKVQKWIKTLSGGIGQLIANITGSAVASGADAAAKGAETVATEATTVAQENLNKTMEMNPIGAVIAAVTALVSALIILTDVLKSDTERAMEDFKNACKDTVESSKSVREEGERSIESIDQQAAANDQLIDEIDNLINAQNDQVDNTDEIQSKVALLNASVEDLNLSYDEEKKQLNMSTALLKKKVKAIEAETKAEAQRNRLLAIQEEQLDVEAKLKDMTEKYGITVDQARAYMDGEGKVMKNLQDVIPGLTGDYIGLMEQMVALGDEYDANAKQITELSGAEAEHAKNATATEAEEAQKQIDIQKRAAESKAEVLARAMNLEQGALERALANGTATMDMLSEKNQETAQRLQDTWSTYKDAATNIFDALSGESELSVDKMIENLQKNQQVISDMGNNMAGLRDRFANLGLDEAILDQLSELGPEAAGEIANLASASDEKLKEVADLYGQGGTLAYDSYTYGMGQAADAAAEQVRSIATKTNDSLRTELENADWTELGAERVQELAEGLGADQAVINAAKKIPTDSIAATRAGYETGSPSKVYEGIGKDVVTGLANGFSALSTRPVTIMRTIVSNTIQIVRAQVGTFEVLGKNAGNGFANGLESTRSRIMQVAASIANSVTQTIQKALNEHSPSKVLEKLGSYAGQGFAIGLAKTEAMVERVSGSIANTVSDAVSSPYRSFSAAYAGGGSVEIQSLRADLADLKNAILSQPIEVTSSFDVNGREMAKGTATYMRDELNRQSTLTNNLGGNR